MSFLCGVIPYCSYSGWQSFPCPRSMTRITCLNKMSTSYIMQGNGTPSFKYHHHPRMSCSDSPPLFRAVPLGDPAWIFSWCQGDRLFLRTVTTLDNYNARERLPEETKEINTSACQATPCNWGRSWGPGTQRAAASPPDGKKIGMRIQGSDRSQQLSTKEDGCLSSESYGYLWLRAELFWIPSRSQLQTRGSAILKGTKYKRRKVNRNIVAMQNAGNQEWAFPSDLGPHKRTGTEAGQNLLPKLGVMGPFTGDFGQLYSELPISA